jgi:hypothetical protein
VSQVSWSVYRSFAYGALLGAIAIAGAFIFIFQFGWGTDFSLVTGALLAVLFSWIIFPATSSWLFSWTQITESLKKE